MRRLLLALTLIMATGTVELVGTQIGTAGSYTGDPAFVKAKAIDGDFATAWIPPSGAGDWIGIDAGVACTVTEVRFAPARGTSNATRFVERDIVGAKVQASSSSTFASDVTDLDTIPTAPYYASNQLNSRTIAGAPSKRYVRWTHATNYPQLAEWRVIANAGPTSAKPVSPVVSPWGGRYPSGSTTVTLSSQTTSASLYYTTDGTTPTSGSTLYTAPFTLTIGGSGTTLKVIAIDGSLGTTDSDVVSADFKPWGYKPREDWKDDRGILIEPHGLGWIKSPGGYPKLVDGYYWCYGAFSNAFHDRSGGSPTDSIGFYGVWCYKTADFRNFSFVGQVLPPITSPYGGEIYGRTHVLYHSGTAKYVMWGLIAYGVSSERVGVATADHPAGPWTFQTTTLNPDGLGYKDCNLYHASDGRAFTAYTPTSQDRIVISQLDPATFLTTTGATPVVAVTGGREAPVLFETVDGSFALLNSTQNYYDDSLTYDMRIAIASDPLGSWGANNAAFSSDPLGTNYNGQTTDAIRFTGGVMVNLDAWNATTQVNSRYVWLPMPTGSSVIERPTEWDLSYLGFSSTPPSVGWMRL